MQEFFLDVQENAESLTISQSILRIDCEDFLESGKNLVYVELFYYLNVCCDLVIDTSLHFSRFSTFHHGTLTAETPILAPNSRLKTFLENDWVRWAV